MKHATTQHVFVMAAWQGRMITLRCFVTTNVQRNLQPAFGGSRP